jgi:hypothetical protein
MELSKIKSIINTTWKWTKFSGWLVWFFLSFPWQIQRGYSQFVNATTFGTSKMQKTPIIIDIDVSPKYYGNLN